MSPTKLLENEVFQSGFETRAQTALGSGVEVAVEMGLSVNYKNLCL